MNGREWAVRLAGAVILGAVLGLLALMAILEPINA